MHIIRRFIILLRPHYKQGAAISALMLLSTALTTISPFFYKELIDQGILNGDSRTLFAMLLVIGLSMAAQEAIYLLRIRFQIRLRKDLFVRLRLQLYAHFMRLPQSFYSERHKGRLLSRITSDVEAVQNLLLDKFVSFGQSLFVGLFIFAIILIVDWRMAAASTAVLPLLYLIYVRFRAKLSERSRKVQEKQEAQMERLQEDLAMVKAIQAYSVEERHIDLAREVLYETEDARSEFSRTYARASSSTVVINIVGLIVIWGMGGVAVMEQRITLGTLVAVSFYLNYIIGLFFNAYYAVMGFHVSAPAARRIFEVLDKPLSDSPEEGTMPASFRGAAVVFKDVSFAYDKGAKPVLQSVDVSLSPGDFAGVVGGSGQGKTTLVNLLLRFYDPDRGAIEIGGTDIRKFRLAELRRQIGYIPQEDLLFNASIRENIVMGRAGVTEEQFVRACRLAKVHEFAERLELGYETSAGQQGQRLSGGQRKRVLIARALLEDPYLLVFDEATASLDEDAEQEILESIAALSAGRIILFISHKLRNLSYANKVLVVESGTVRTVMDKNEIQKMVEKY
ncbi:ABC transporter ATP-binding protein [Paenibacillus sp.]|uniref:ABC transporter ATP-binding protein n=1 Tax=Paenibacillus sp. TaxID=58172 RepID=UPI002D693E2D|nr:ABC transporter ATP-binding protein [Paenibacillus sp.]HZG88380.1 ABC transporter ATP-binding protein [Paenibacillus sp.]